MKYAIIENEEISRLNLLNIIKNIRPSFECVFMAETVADTVEYFSTQQDVQLVFMDVELGDSDCFNIFKQIEMDLPIVFTTAYDEYALRAFKVNSIDYLLKPIMEDDVLHAIEKLEKSLEKKNDYRNLAKEMALAPRGRLLVGNSAGYSLVKTEDIAWVEAEDKTILLVLKNGRKMITDLPSLGDVIAKLDPNVFWQVSRSVVASVDSIAKVSKFFKGRLSVELRAKDLTRTEIVSSQRKQKFLEWLGY